MIDPKRNVGIDFLKFMAAILVVNSHVDIMYGKYAFLSTGGTLGDILFFFCSGYTLFMKPISKASGGGTFVNWYKRRISRIWPGLIVVALIKVKVFNDNVSVYDAFFDHGYWFIDCIMIYYVFIYLIGVFWKWDYKWIYLMVSIATFIWYFAKDKPNGYAMYYSGEIIRWLPYFLLMLMGAQLGKESQDANRKQDKMNAWLHLLLFFIYTTLFYVIFGLSIRISNLFWIQPFSFIPLLPCIMHLYRFACSSKLDKFIRRWYFIIGTIGGLCLEIYFSQYFFITDKYNQYFPMNIIVMFIVTIIFAYLLRCCSRVFAQTFNQSPYDWKSIVKVY